MSAAFSELFIPTRSQKLQVKQFCIGRLAYIIWAICITYKSWLIKIFVVTVLSQYADYNLLLLNNVFDLWQFF